MYPAYPWTDSYPYHTNPTAREIDRGMNLPYYPWPYASHHSYPIPQGCHSCCNHSYFGCPYSFTSPYHHHPPPFHTHGFYPPFPGAHPAYPVPPPHYSMEQPRYDYDKNTPTTTTHHCSGCEKKSNIGQEEPEVEKKTFLKDCPYPIMWVPPSYMNTESNAKEKENHSHNPVLKPIEPSKQGGNDEIPQESFPFPIFWLPSKNNEVKKDMKEDNHNLEEKTRKNDEAESETSSKNGVQKVIPVKQLGIKDNGKEGKTSKLPPVCLRIDPLPRKKNSEKERSKVSTMQDSKSFKQQTQDLKNESKKVEKDSVVDSCSEKGVEQDRRKFLSENEAVLMIQSVYRGFEVRKSQPLMKLRQIGQVGKQVVDLRNRIQDLESSMDDKQKLIIGETIMSLLLKLDTIQGLHPIVRDVRKSVAKELVGLQEKLDSLTFVKSETLIEEKNHEVEATESQEDDGGKIRNTTLEPQVELQDEENTGELNNDQIPTLVEPEQTIDDDSIDHKVKAADAIHDMKPEQLVEQISGELNNDHVEAQSSSNDEAVRLDLEENHEVEVTDPVHDMKPEQLVEQITGDVNNDQIQMAVDDDVIREKSDQAQAESESGISVETMESGGREAGDINLESQVESDGKQSIVEITGDQLEMEEEIEPPVEEEKSDQREALISKNVDSMEDVTTATVEEETDVGTVELVKEDVDLEEALMVDDVDGGSKEVVSLEVFGGAPPQSATGSHVSSGGGDRKIMEENERLRVVVEELMKAGNEQVSVIRELTGRVKDLEKKLSKKKMKVKRSGRRPRGSLVEEVYVV